MKEKDNKNASWIMNGFITKDLYAPFVIEKDIDYRDALSDKYRIHMNKLKMLELTMKH